ncbi:MAG: vanadium-dependent haloperoxidase [Planctomycetes bacterium]|nr:vanadium-dependent haloperoxidase [Planctomycetota bacterium]
MATLVLAAVVIVPASAAGAGQPSIARQWNEELLSAIRRDFARPTVHARNLFHVSLAMWDAWAAYDPLADTFLVSEHAFAADVATARDEAISFAAYRVLRARFAASPGAALSLASFDARMAALGYDRNFTSTLGDSPAALGNRIAGAVLQFGYADHSNELLGYANQYYLPVNPPLIPPLAGNPGIVDANRWQPLALDYFIDQAGNPIPGGFPPALSPEWGQVTPFALSADDRTIYHRDGFDYWVYYDPGPPPLIGGVGDEYYKWGFEQVVIWSSHLDPTDGVMWDISPASRGNSPLPDPADYQTFYDLLDGGDTSTGYLANPVTGQPYPPNVVPRGDFARVLAEFWADGPQSETPPGHWFVVLNYVSDHPMFEKRFGGTGPLVDDLEWDVKCYLALGGAMHDVAVTVWGLKGWYDYIRPISAIRYMADLGQCSDPALPRFHLQGIHLYPGMIEMVTAASSAPGGRHAHLAGNINKIAVKAWRGPSEISNPANDVAGVGWILAEDWWPYQRPTFVTPPFPGYTSGHSAYSRGAAEVLTLLTGSQYFPGGLGEFHCPQNQYLVFEDGPSVPITLQWASYYDAADQSALSRIWGGIHPGQDDLPSRLLGAIVGPNAFAYAVRLFTGAAGACIDGNDELDTDADQVAEACDACPETIPAVAVDAAGCPPAVVGDHNRDGDVDLRDISNLLVCFGSGAAGACARFDGNTDQQITTDDWPLIRDVCNGPNVPATAR